ncbi:hypothetical protein FOCC_FOCC002745 [Frankliniella occidentalis]|nr:hypothetical protein FOCC_FOCC002745 [Frankliniella occidentalis]
MLGDLGRLVSALDVDEVEQLNISLAHERALDTLSVIGEHVTDPAVLDAVAARLEQQNPKLRAVAGSAGPAEYIELQPDSLLVALGPLACHLQLDLQRLLLARRGALLHAAHSLQGVALHCNASCLGELARAAASDAALGAPANWTAEDVRDMGVIAAGLNTEQLSQLQRALAEVEQPLSGLTASAVSCMSPEQVQALGDHLGVLSPVAAAAVTPLQQQDMTSNQLAALLRVRNLAFTRQLGKSDHDDFEYPTTDSSPRQRPHVSLLVLLLILPYFLSTSSARGLSAIVRKHPKDPVVARAILSALDAVDDQKRVGFIRELGLKSGLSAEVQAAIGEAAVRWWGSDLTEHSLDLATAGTPLLAALPPGYLAELDTEHTETMLMRLRNYPWEDRNDPRWSEQPPETKRVWMAMFKKDAKSGKGQLVNAATDGLKMLWAGATPDEINDLQCREEDRATLTALSGFSKLQVRALVDRLYSKKALSSMEMNELFGWMLDLAPAGLQRFLANDTDFSSLPSADTSHASLATLKQVLEQVVASGLFQGRITTADHPGTWGRSLKDVGRLTYLIRATLLSNYTMSTHRLPPDVLAAVDTYKLSAMQARYLTNKGAFLDLRRPLKELETYHGLTRAMPTARLAALRPTAVSNDVMLHFLESIPATHPGRSATLFNKLRQSMTEPKVLDAILRNPTPAQYWTLVSAHEVAAEREALEEAYQQLKSPTSRMASTFTLGDWIDSTLNLNMKDGIEKHLPLVPVDKLSAILGSARRDLSLSPSGKRRVVWTTDTLLSPSRPLVNGALLGLTCADVMAMDLVDFPVILAEFNRRTRAAGLPFPKRLQHCLQRALEDYMDMRRRIRRFNVTVPLVAVLEPSDIEAVGGYVLSTLRPGHIHHSAHAVQILSTIGALPPQELLAAVPSMERLRELALHLVDIFRARRSVGARCLFALGNLHMFLPADVIYSIDPEAWKLFVEATAGQPRSLAMCAGSEQRDAWHRLAVRAFGSPSQWSAGVVAALGDNLAALPADVLSWVRVASWKDAADTLSSRTVFHLPCGGSEQPRPFVEVCRSLLPAEERSAYYWSVRRTARFYLRASQDLMDTVMKADSLVRRLQFAHAI